MTPSVLASLRHALPRGLAVLLGLATLAGTATAADSKITYDDHMGPLFRQKCSGCHNPNKKSGGLDLTSYLNLMQGGSSGEVIAPGDVGESYLYQLASHQQQPFMPPNGSKVSDDFLKTLEAWITGGALENQSSKPVAMKPKADLGLGEVSNTRPAGAPPMPSRLSLEPVIHTERQTAVTALATNPWSKLLAVSGQEQVLLYHTETAQLIGVLPFPEGRAHILKFSRNGKFLLAGGGQHSYSGYVVLWDVVTGERIAKLGDEYDTVLAADISSDSTLVALGGPERIVRVLSVETGEEVYKIKKHTDWIYSLEFSPDSVLLATGDRTGGLFVWEAATGREYLGLPDHKGGINDVSWRADSNVLASGSEDGTIKFWEMEEGKALKSFNAHGGGVAAIEFARDGMLVSTGRDKTTKLWDQNGSQKRAFEALPDLGLEVTVDDESGRVIAGDWTGLIRMWSLEDGKRVAEITPNPLPLAKHVALAKSEQARAKAAADAAAAKQKAATEAYNAVEAKRVAKENEVKTLETNLTAQTKMVEQLTAAMKAAEATVNAAKAELGTVTPAIAPLTEANAKLKAASDAVGGKNESLKVLLAQAEKTLADLNAKKTAADAKLAKATTELKDATAKKTAAEQQVAQTKKSLDEAKKALPELTKQRDAAKKANDEAVKQQQATATAMAQSAERVQFWLAEVEFDQKLRSLDELRERNGEALAALQDAKADLAEAKQQMTTLQEQVTTIDNGLKSIAGQITTATAKKTELVAMKETLTKQKSVVETELAKIREVKTKTVEVLSEKPEDMAAKQILAQIDTAIDQKAKTVTQTAAMLDAKAKEMASVDTMLTEKEKAKTELATKKAEAAKQLQTVQTEVQKLTTETAQAEAAAKATSDDLAKAKAEIEQLRTAGRDVAMNGS